MIPLAANSRELAEKKAFIFASQRRASCLISRVFFSSLFVHFELYRLINSSYRGKLLCILSSVDLIFFLLKNKCLHKKLKELSTSLLRKQVGKNLEQWDGGGERGELKRFLYFKLKFRIKGTRLSRVIVKAFLKVPSA